MIREIDPLTMKRLNVGLAILIVGLVTLARLVPGPRTIDDAFITFRYSRNILAGQGFVYNPGERIMGTTTPLYTLIMAGLGGLAGGTGANFPMIALIVNMLADSGTALLIWRVGKKLGAEKAGVAAALLWAVAPFSVTFAIGGLETSVYVFLLTSAAACYLEERLELAALSGALALLTRVDALVLLAPMGLDWLIRWIAKKKQNLPQVIPFRAVAAFLIPVLAWYGFAALYFGSILPHSIQAKLLAYRLEPYAALIRLIQHYATPFLDNNILGSTGILIGVFVYPFLYLIGARFAWKQNNRSVAWIAYPWLYLLAFAVPNPLIFRWYLTPPLPFYFLVILVGLEQVLALAFTAGKRKKLSLIHAGLVMGILVLYPLLFSMSDWRLHPDHGADRPAPDMAYIQLEVLYRQAADVVSPLMNQTSVLAAGDVGVLGFYTPGRILDTVGLNSPVALKYYPLDPTNYVINYAIAPNLILDEKPDFVVILEVYGRKGLLKDASFNQQYQLVKKIETDMYGSDGMLIFSKK
jgi:4-amino-4-deoxy-L-arabinose transferase-like glycosyltransferase